MDYFFQDSRGDRYFINGLFFFGIVEAIALLSMDYFFGIVEAIAISSMDYFFGIAQRWAIAILSILIYFRDMSTLGDRYLSMDYFFSG